MPKNDKKPEKPKSTKTRIAVPHVKYSYGKFKFPNNDKYVGEFMANYDTREIVRQGRGVYKTWDGQKYDCFWINDNISKYKEATITYADNSVYKGLISSNNEYTGELCTYKFSDGSIIVGKFSKNTPQEDDMVFTDPNGYRWDHKFKGEYLELRRNNGFIQSDPKKEKEKKK